MLVENSFGAEQDFHVRMKRNPQYYQQYPQYSYGQQYQQYPQYPQYNYGQQYQDYPEQNPRAHGIGTLIAKAGTWLGKTFGTGMVVGAGEEGGKKVLEGLTSMNG